MRRLVAVILCVGLSVNAWAQILGLDAFCTGGYNRTERFNVSSGAVLTWNPAANVSLKGGLMFTSGLSVGGEAGVGVLFPLKHNHTLSLESLYIYNEHFRYGIAEMNFLALAGWQWNGRISVKAGLFNRYFLSRPEKWFTEPFNAAYHIEGWFLRSESSFNFGAELGNIDDFKAERLCAPYAGLIFKYRVNSSIGLYAKLRNQDCGTFDLTSNFFSTLLKIGVQMSW